MTDAMTRLMQTAVVSAAVVLAVGVDSAMAISAISSTWEGYYEADALPFDTPDILGEYGWGDQSGGQDNMVVVSDGSSNYINYNYNNGDGAGSYEGVRYLGNTDGANNGASDPDVDRLNPQTNGGISLEMRVRVRAGSILMHLWPSSVGNARWLTTYITGETVTIKDSDNSFFGEATVTANGPGEWTTVRLTTDDTNWNVYRDMDQSASCSVVGDSGAYGLYQWAIYGEQSNADFDLDYLRWTNGGAFAPVIPEPATMALLGLGGLAMLRRRRNR